MGSIVRLAQLVGMLLLGTGIAPADPSHGILGMVRDLYFAAVEDGDAVDRAMLEVRRLLRSVDKADGALESTLVAYEGALITLQAKHGRWPPRRLQQLREGLTVLDRVVRENPNNVEARYLRLMSCYYLPGIVGRRQSVIEDFAALARMLPTVADEYPRELFVAIVTFVIEQGNPGPAEERALRAAISNDEG
jgi:hypothetical protein